MKKWYWVDDRDLDSPALLVYPDRARANMEQAIELAGGPGRLRPHVKTHKIREIAEMFVRAGVQRFKCATIAEAEMLALAGAADVLLAYQPSYAKARRLAALSKAYPYTLFSCLADNQTSMKTLAEVFYPTLLNVYIDINCGMNRTGILPTQAPALHEGARRFSNIRMAGLHVYDGHLTDPDPCVRFAQAENIYASIKAVQLEIKDRSGETPGLVIGGMTSFPWYTKFDSDVECSPGTFIFWDEGYRRLMPELPFMFAAVLLTRIVSIIDDTKLCLDLGYKSVAAEKPFPRVRFLNVDDAIPVLHSEEHLVVEVPDTKKHRVGDSWYAVPIHICPTVALYDSVYVVEDNRPSGNWNVIARDRFINF